MNALRVALRIFSRKNIYNFAILENLRIFQNCLFTGGVGTNSLTQEKAVCRVADSLFQKKIRKTRTQKGRVSIRTYFRPCSARCA